ncbi:WD40-repeat-containing domain protein [Rhodotorula diobovata]|uniref:WD40-repeat-containing domain protein n=1 Tax=Rhodotorula diobovata TaxID=5288 RepID=A0A5C5G1R0_9BASI|nr:WD40-repeat-containing domain protein [Rhodotorula diobovata]
MPRSSHGEGGFLSGLRSQFTADPAPAPAPPPAREPAPAAVTASSTASSYLPNPSNLLVDLAPALLSSSSRILHPSTISTHRASLTSSSSSSSTAQSTAAHSLRRKLSFLRAGLTLGRPNQPLQSWSDLSTQLYLRDRVDELLSLPVPPAPFPLSAPLAARPGAQAIEAPAPAPRPDDPVPLLQGFAATIPAAQLPRAERRRRRAVRSERALGLEGAAGAGAGDSARLLGGGGTGAAAGGELTIGRRSRGRKGPAAGAAAEGGGAGKPPLETREELERDVLEVRRDMANVGVRRALVNGQVRDVEEQIAKLAKVRDELRRGLLGLREEELELEDELEGLQARLSRLPLTTTSLPSALSSSSSAAGASRGLSVVDDANGGMAPFASTSSRRRKGPAFLPSEHDDLPPNVAFMTLSGHLSPILSLDFSEPYGTLVSSSSDGSVRLWDLTTGAESGFLAGHSGVVKALQVEGGVCVTGGEDGKIKVWDLERAEDDFYEGVVSGGRRDAPGARVEEDVFGPTGTATGAGLVNGLAGVGVTVEQDDNGLLREEPSSITSSSSSAAPAGEDGPSSTSTSPSTGACVRSLSGHTRAVTSLFFDSSTLVTGSSDSTLRQWDLTTGQCVQTMDILWAISNPLPSSSVLYPASSYSPSTVDPFAHSFSAGAGAASSPPTTPRKAAAASSLRRQSSLFESPGAMAAPTTATYADGSWELYDDFVGGVMFWGYALASGTRDGCVRMWDMRTGQAHRTLVGHTGPVTCLQFDEYHLVSGSLDRTIRIWDLRTGSISDTLRYDHAVTSLQFDSRKVLCTAGGNDVSVYNRTTMEHSSLRTNGHHAPVERLRFMDRYAASGGRDAMVKVWALQ